MSIEDLPIGQAGDMLVDINDFPTAAGSIIINEINYKRFMEDKPLLTEEEQMEIHILIDLQM